MYIYMYIYICIYVERERDTYICVYIYIYMICSLTLISVHPVSCHRVAVSGRRGAVGLQRHIYMYASISIYLSLSLSIYIYIYIYTYMSSRWFSRASSSLSFYVGIQQTFLCLEKAKTPTYSSEDACKLCAVHT